MSVHHNSQLTAKRKQQLKPQLTPVRWLFTEMNTLKDTSVHHNSQHTQGSNVHHSSHLYAGCSQEWMPTIFMLALCAAVIDRGQSSKTCSAGGSHQCCRGQSSKTGGSHQRPAVQGAGIKDRGKSSKTGGSHQIQGTGIKDRGQASKTCNGRAQL